MKTTLAAIAAAALCSPAAAQAAVRDGGPQQAQVAAQICSNLQQQLGAGFASMYGTLDRCDQQVAGQAQSIIDGCASAGQPGTSGYRQCIQTGVGQAVQQITGAGTGATMTPAPSAAQVAGDICGDLRSGLGASFPARFGTLAGCRQTLASVARIVIAACTSTAQPGTDAFKQCMDRRVAVAVTAQRATICANLQHKLGAKAFDKQYGSLARCKSAKG